MNPPPCDAGAPLADLSRLLWRQRQLLESLRYRLHVQALLVDADHSDLLRHAVDDVHAVLATLSEVEAERRDLVTEIGHATGLGDHPTLMELVVSAPEPYDVILADHRDTHRALVTELATTSVHVLGSLERRAPALTEQETRLA